MERRGTPALTAVGLVMVFAAGCSHWWGSGPFLSDYSKLEPERVGVARAPGCALRYVNPKIGAYSRVIVEPVDISFYQPHRRVKTDDDVLRDLANYTHNAVIEALTPRYVIVCRPGPRVARLRVALTDLDADARSLRRIDEAAVTNLGLGGAAFEVEAVDAETGEQLLALVQAPRGGRFTLAELSNWGQAKAVVDAWAVAMRKRIDRARGLAADQVRKDARLADLD